MSGEAPLKQTLAALGEVALRRSWLKERLGGWPATRAASTLNELLLEAEYEALARQALLSLVSLLVHQPEDDTWASLRASAKERGLLSLDRLLDFQTLAVTDEPAPNASIPDYGAGRELSLGERRSLARRPSRRLSDRLLSDPHPWVIELLLDNPKLTEDDVVRLSTRRPARITTLVQIVRHDRWLCRNRIRKSVILNPYAPDALAIPLLHLCSRSELAEVKRSAHLPGKVRSIALSLFERRAPLAEVEVEGIDFQ
jgi:hypothetical protein